MTMSLVEIPTMLPLPWYSSRTVPPWMVIVRSPRTPTVKRFGGAMGDAPNVAPPLVWIGARRKPPRHGEPTERDPPLDLDRVQAEAAPHFGEVDVRPDRDPRKRRPEREVPHC